MAAAVAVPPRMSSHTSEDSSIMSDQGPAGFTAVNGREGPSAHVNGNATHHSKHQSKDSSDSADSERRVELVNTSKPNGHGGPDAGLHKRKRSPSREYNGYSPPQYDYSPPKRLEQPQHMAGRALNVLKDAERESPPRYSQTPNGAGHHSKSHAWPEQATAQRAGYETNGTRHDSTEAHLAEALQQATHDESHAPRDWGSENGELADRERHGSYNGDSSAPMGTTVNGKRKRNFSNRTKTGCLTCRRRKKKCDEQHPTCNNCQRGGFQCEGYSTSQTPWKMSATKQHIALQSKDGYTDRSASPYKNSTSPDTRQPPYEHEGAPKRPITIDDNESSVGHFTSSPQSTEPRSRGSYPGQSWPQQGHPSYNNADHLPPFSELTRPEPAKSDYSNVPMRNMSRPVDTSSHPPPAPNPQTGQWQGQGSAQQEYRPNYPSQRIEQRIDTAGNHAPPRASLTGYQSGPRTFTQGDVEKSKMIRGAQYNHFDPTLKNERQRCEEALERYNSACKLRSGVPEEAAEELFRKVLDPSRDTSHRPLVPCKEQGILGPGVKVEGPFACTYGYNLQLFDNVYIGKNVTIDDAAQVRIGARAWIGPNVTVFTSDVSRDMIDRKGTESRWMARPVIIGDEVIIGQNAVIYPGVTLGRGSTVEPFAVVKSHLGDNQVQLSSPGQRAQH